MLLELSRYQAQLSQGLTQRGIAFVGLTASESEMSDQCGKPPSSSSAHDFVPATAIRVPNKIGERLDVPDLVVGIEQYRDLVASLLPSNWVLLCHRTEGIGRLPLHTAYPMYSQEYPATLTSHCQDKLPAMGPRMPKNLVARFRDRCLVMVYWGYYVLHLSLASQLVK